MKLPRVRCPRCGRPTAVGPVAGRASKGRLWRHDDPGMLRVPDQPLVSCRDSLTLVDMPLPGRQLELDVEPEQAEDALEHSSAIALF